MVQLQKMPQQIGIVSVGALETRDELLCLGKDIEICGVSRLVLCLDVAAVAGK